MLTCGPWLAASGRERRGSWAALALWAGREGGRRKREGEKEVGCGVLGQKGGGEGFGEFSFLLSFLKPFSNSRIKL
jgi:hypothetical protein